MCRSLNTIPRDFITKCLHWVAPFAMCGRTSFSSIFLVKFYLQWCRNTAHVWSHPDYLVLLWLTIVMVVALRGYMALPGYGRARFLTLRVHVASANATELFFAYSSSGDAGDILGEANPVIKTGFCLRLFRIPSKRCPRKKIKDVRSPQKRVILL